MEVKKSPKADLEKGRSTWLLLGYVMILAFLFVAFEWSNKDVVIDTSQAVQAATFEEEIMPITEQDNTPPPPPPPPAEIPPQVEEIINVVKNDEEVADVTIADSEDTGEKVEQKVFIPQVVDEEPEEEEIFMVAETMPEFPGGMAELMKYLSKNIKYPTIAQENGVQGRVTVTFTVNRDGSIVDPQVVRGVDPSLDKEAIRVISSMPNWKPGEQRGKKVRVKYTVPVTFRLK